MVQPELTTDVGYYRSARGDQLIVRGRASEERARATIRRSAAVGHQRLRPHVVVLVRVSSLHVVAHRHPSSYSCRLSRAVRVSVEAVRARRRQSEDVSRCACTVGSNARVSRHAVVPATRDKQLSARERSSASRVAGDGMIRRRSVVLLNASA